MWPLYDLAKKDQFTDWKEKHQTAFKAIKSKLITVFATPHLNPEPFLIETIALKHELAACLLQQTPKL